MQANHAPRELADRNESISITKDAFCNFCDPQGRSSSATLLRGLRDAREARP